MKQCNHVSCRTLIPFDERYCGKHLHKERERNRRYDKRREERDEKYRKIYHSTRWRKLRKQVLLRDDHLCRLCRLNVLITPAAEVDHIIELRDDINKAFDAENLQSLCSSCHRDKTIEEQKKRAQREAE